MVDELVGDLVSGESPRCSSRMQQLRALAMVIVRAVERCDQRAHSYWRPCIAGTRLCTGTAHIPFTLPVRPFRTRSTPPVAGSPDLHRLVVAGGGVAEANRAYSAVVRFEVVTPEPGVVDAWSMRRLLFEPSGWLVDFRSHFATACRSLIADQDQVLHAIYSSAVHELCDMENVLTYNLGTGAIRRAATYGLILERSFVAERDFRHHYRYELRPGTLVSRVVTLFTVGGAGQ